MSCRPASMEGRLQPQGEPDGRDGALRDACRIEDVHIGEHSLSIRHRLHDPAIAFRRIRCARYETRLHRGTAGRSRPGLRRSRLKVYMSQLVAGASETQQPAMAIGPHLVAVVVAGELADEV